MNIAPPMKCERQLKYAILVSPASESPPKSARVTTPVPPPPVTLKDVTSLGALFEPETVTINLFLPTTESPTTTKRELAIFAVPSFTWTKCRVNLVVAKLESLTLQTIAPPVPPT